MREERVVGIIGSGVAGAATAHFLKESRPDLRVIVFERDGVIGGRAKTVDLAGRRAFRPCWMRVKIPSDPSQILLVSRKKSRLTRVKNPFFWKVSESFGIDSYPPNLLIPSIPPCSSLHMRGWCRLGGTLL